MNEITKLAILLGGENSQGETGEGSDGAEGNPSSGCGDNSTGK